MVITVTEYSFIQEFNQQYRTDKFSDNALKVLFEYFTEYEESSDVQIELDVVGICCEYT